MQDVQPLGALVDLCRTIDQVIYRPGNYWKQELTVAGSVSRCYNSYIVTVTCKFFDNSCEMYPFSRYKFLNMLLITWYIY